MFKDIRNFFNGMAFGVTEIVPGVSGGTIALVLGFYYELIEIVNHFAENHRKYLRYLFPFLLGNAVGVIVFSSIMNYLLTSHSFPTMSFFMGLIAGVIPMVYVKAKEPGRGFRPGEIALAALPVLMLVIISELKSPVITAPAEIINNMGVPFMLFIFLAGIMAAMALVLPGFSGSFVLLLLGIYHLAIYSISSIRHLLADITNVPLMLDIGKVLGPLGIGIIIGVLLMARVIEKSLKNYYRGTYLVILGLLIGSVYALCKAPIVFQSGTSAAILVAGLATFLSGGAISFALGKKQI
ncbi:MAG: DUF368 domain-containing protein [Synergistaceae bacterium]|nr:DUF368 domain-containing protein [Synergistaceae bacterium]